MKRQIIFVILIACLINLLSACGQSGKLYLPEKQPITNTAQQTSHDNAR